MDYYHSYLEAREMLLKGKISVYGHENIELLFGEREKLTISHGRPPHLRHGADVVSGQFPREAAIHTLVEENPHEAFATIRAFASSRKATTWSRFTVGKPSRNSSMVSPASR